MDHITSNKKAWEEAYNSRLPGWEEDIIRRIRNEKYPFLTKELANEISDYDLKNKAAAQFCCNNGRELLSIVKSGACFGTGFDIAKNMITAADEMAAKLGLKCKFISTDISKIDHSFYDSFDVIFITAGALTWFSDLFDFFMKVSLCLKKGAVLFINEIHPFTNMLAVNSEDEYDDQAQNKLIYSYFKDGPWIENSMSYISDKTTANTFYSFSHTMSHIIDSICQNGIRIRKLTEYEHDISDMFAHLNNTGIPLSYILTGQKD